MANETEPPLTFTTRRFSVEIDRVLVAVALGAAGAEVAARVPFGLEGEEDGQEREGSPFRVRAGAAAVLDGEGAELGRAVPRAGTVERGFGVLSCAEEAAVGVPRTCGPVGASRGSSESPMRPMTALTGSMLASSKTSLRSTSRTPNQATEIARMVAPHHTAMSPSVCRIS